MDRFAWIMEGESFEQCLKRAATSLNRSEQDLCLEVLEEGAPGKPWLILAAASEDRERLRNMDGAFYLSYEGDGVYLEILPARGCGSPVDQKEILDYLRRKKISMLDEAGLASILGKPCGRRSIAPPQEEFLLGAQALVTVSKDEMEAYLSFLPPEPGGEKASVELAEAALRDAGVVYGIDTEAIKAMVDNECYGIERLIAKGTAPQDGSDAEIILLFSVEHDGSPVIGSDGRADFRNLQLFTAVNEGDKLAEKKPATRGVPGYTVKGRELKPRDGKDLPLPRGKNIRYDEYKLRVFAAITGRVDYVNQAIVVSDCYTVRGDADLSVGNIDFDGTVVVMGNVISDQTIKATRDIEIHGSVEGARLIAGGKITLFRGMQGSDKGILEAGDDIRAKYIERATVKARGNIYVDSMIHCQAESGKSIFAQGRHGSIIGGSARAHNNISALSLGSAGNSKTEVAVGIAPAKRVRLQFLRGELKRLNTELEKLEKVGKYLSQMGDIPAEKQQLKRTVVLGKIEHARRIKEYKEEIQKIEEEAVYGAKGRIHVRDTVYPGVKISIGLGEMKITSPIKYVTFRFDGQDILYSPYQL